MGRHRSVACVRQVGTTCGVAAGRKASLAASQGVVARAACLPPSAPGAGAQAPHTWRQGTQAPAPPFLPRPTPPQRPACALTLPLPAPP